MSSSLGGTNGLAGRRSWRQWPAPPAGSRFFLVESNQWQLVLETISIDNLSNHIQSIMLNDSIRFSHWTVCYQKIDQDHVREKAKIIPKNPAKLYHLATFFWLSAHTLPTVQAWTFTHARIIRLAIDGDGSGRFWSLEKSNKTPTVDGTRQVVFNG